MTFSVTLRVAVVPTFALLEYLLNCVILDPAKEYHPFALVVIIDPAKEYHPYKILNNLSTECYTNIRQKKAIYVLESARIYVIKWFAWHTHRANSLCTIPVIVLPIVTCKFWSYHVMLVTAHWQALRSLGHIASMFVVTFTQAKVGHGAGINHKESNFKIKWMCTLSSNCLVFNT